MSSFEHVPVLVREVLDALAPKPGATLLDATLGLGGHADAWLDAAGDDGRVVGMDRDRDALGRARARLEPRHPGRTHYHHGSYEDAGQAVRGAGLASVDAALMDLGASSLQLDAADRGFSFQAAGPLDMRMDAGACGETAADVVNGCSAEELRQLFTECGEEPAAHRVARRIVEERRRAPFRDTLRLAEVVADAAGGRKGKLHPATRVFQALRIRVNDELGRLERGVPAVLGQVRTGGRTAVISFHRLEDRIVKRCFTEARRAGDVSDLPGATACRSEQSANPRSRSARLRAVEVTRG